MFPSYQYRNSNSSDDSSSFAESRFYNSSSSDSNSNDGSSSSNDSASYVFGSDYYVVNRDLMDSEHRINQDVYIKPNGLYIGFARLLPEGEWLLGSAISSKSFFLFSITEVVRYLKMMAGNYGDYWIAMSQHIEILDMKAGPHTEYIVTIKTFWIRCIQRAWRKRYNAFIKKLKSPAYIHEMMTKYIPFSQRRPNLHCSLRGLLTTPIGTQKLKQYMSSIQTQQQPSLFERVFHS
jgi:hypothetical protein